MNLEQFLLRAFLDQTRIFDRPSSSSDRGRVLTISFHGQLLPVRTLFLRIVRYVRNVVLTAERLKSVTDNPAAAEVFAVG
jgi:hypothetical protein